MKDIPCKGCLIIPICKHKVVIKCSILYNYIRHTENPKIYSLVRLVLDRDKSWISRKIIGDGGYLWL